MEGSHTGYAEQRRSDGGKYERFETCFANCWLIGDYGENGFFLNEEIRCLLKKT